MNRLLLFGGLGIGSLAVMYFIRQRFFTSHLTTKTRMKKRLNTPAASSSPSSSRDEAPEDSTEPPARHTYSRGKLKRNTSAAAAVDDDAPAARSSPPESSTKAKGRVAASSTRATADSPKTASSSTARSSSSSSSATYSSPSPSQKSPAVAAASSVPSASSSAALAAASSSSSPSAAAAAPAPKTVDPEVRALFVEMQKKQRLGDLQGVIDATVKLVNRFEQTSPQSRNHLGGLKMLVEAYAAADQVTDALRVAQQSYQLAHQLYAKGNPSVSDRDLAHTSGQLTDLLIRLDRPSEAVTFARETVDRYTKAAPFDRQNETIGFASWNLGLAHSRLQQYTEAEAALRRSMELLGTLPDEDVKLSLSVQTTLLCVLFDGQRVDEATKLYTQMLARLNAAKFELRDHLLLVQPVVRELLNRGQTRIADELLKQTLYKCAEAKRPDLSLELLSLQLASIREANSRSTGGSVTLPDASTLAPSAQEQAIIAQIRSILVANGKLRPPRSLTPMLRTWNAVLALASKDKTSSSTQYAYRWVIDIREAVPTSSPRQTRLGKLLRTLLPGGPQEVTVKLTFQHPDSARLPLVRETRLSLASPAASSAQNVMEFMSQPAAGFTADQLYEGTVELWTIEATPRLLDRHTQLFRFFPKN